MIEPLGLSIYTTSELVDELAKRFDVVLVAGSSSHTDLEDRQVTEWRGGPSAAIGLAHTSLLVIEQHWKESSEQE